MAWPRCFLPENNAVLIVFCRVSCKAGSAPTLRNGPGCKWLFFSFFCFFFFSAFATRAGAIREMSWILNPLSLIYWRWSDTGACRSWGRFFVTPGNLGFTPVASSPAVGMLGQWGGDTTHGRARSHPNVTLCVPWWPRTWFSSGSHRAEHMEQSV